MARICNRHDRSRVALPWSVLGSVLAISIGSALLWYVVVFQEGYSQLLMGEGRFIELASFFLWLLSAVLSVFVAQRYASRTHLYIAFITMAFALRELDLDKKFTTMGILKSRFYLDGQVPWSEKAIGMCIAVVIATVMIALGRRWVTRVKGKGWKIDWVTGMGALVVLILALARMFDGMDEKLARFGVEASPFFLYTVPPTEEILEFAAPLIALVGLWAYCRSKQVPAQVSSPD